MIGHGTELARQEARRDSAGARVVEFEAALAALDAAKPDEGDIDAVLAFEERRGAAEARVRIARRALEVAQAGLAQAEAEAAEKVKDRAHSEASKVAEAGSKLTREIAADCAALAAKLARLEGMREAVEVANAERGARPYIVDGEQRVRETPARTIPASFREETVWVDAQGHQPSQIRTLSDGRRVDMSGNPLRQETRRVEQSTERFEPAQMPMRLAEAVVLPSLDGRTALWPR